MQEKQTEEKGCLEGCMGFIQTIILLIVFLGVGIITGISSFDLFKDGSFLYGIGLGFLCLFSFGLVWLSVSELTGKDKE